MLNDDKKIQEEIDNAFNLLGKNNNFNNELSAFNINKNEVDRMSSISLGTPKGVTTEILNTEELFLNQKKEIQKIKNKNESNKVLKKNVNSPIINNKKQKLKLKENNNEKEFKDIISKIELKDYTFFQTGLFDVVYEEQEQCDEENSIPVVKDEFITFDNELGKSEESIEFDKRSLRTIHENNYSTNGIEINVSFSLFGQSEFWIFTRSFVNKNYNYSIDFDEESKNIDSINVFNKYTSAIKINKELNKNKCFITLGTFYENPKSKNLHYKSFLKRQLVDFDFNKEKEENNQNNSDNIDFYELSKDFCDINLKVFDLGSEIIEIKASLNSEDKYNTIKGKFFLPINKRAKIMFGGYGNSIQVKNIIIKSFPKISNQNGDIEFEKLSSFFNLEQNSCSCCDIY